MTCPDFTFIAALLKERSGLIITPDKQYLLETRLTPIVRELGLSGLPALFDRLRQPGSLAVRDQVVDAMTTNETSFFRDTHPFESLRKSVIPELAARRAGSRSIRIWSAACSTGQEPYSLVMMLKDHFPALENWKIEIIATDISPSVLARAREGLYSTFEAQRGMPIHSLIRHFDQVEGGWQIKPEMRRAVTFRAANLLEDFSGLGAFDLILCRNVLIYFDQPTKTRILDAMARQLGPDGALLLGGAESVFGLCASLAARPGLKGVYGRSPAKPAATAAQPARLSAAS